MKTYTVLACVVALNLNCHEMKDKECLETTNFNQLKTQIIESNSTIPLHERLVADKSTTALELSVKDKYLELVVNEGNDEIIVIDKHGEIPTYYCSIKDGNLEFSAYEARFDTDRDIEKRRKDWCMLIETLVIKN